MYTQATQCVDVCTRVLLPTGRRPSSRARLDAAASWCVEAGYIVLGAVLSRPCTVWQCIRLKIQTVYTCNHHTDPRYVQTLPYIYLSMILYIHTLCYRSYVSSYLTATISKKVVVYKDFGQDFILSSILQFNRVLPVPTVPR